MEDTFKGVFTRENVNEASESEDRPRQSELRMVNFTTRTIEQKKAGLSKAARPDRIGPRLLKELASRLALDVADIFNKSMADRETKED